MAELTRTLVVNGVVNSVGAPFTHPLPFPNIPGLVVELHSLHQWVDAAEDSARVDAFLSAAIFHDPTNFAALVEINDPKVIHSWLFQLAFGSDVGSEMLRSNYDVSFPAPLPLVGPKGFMMVASGVQYDARNFGMRLHYTTRRVSRTEYLQLYTLQNDFEPGRTS